MDMDTRDGQPQPIHGVGVVTPDTPFTRSLGITPPPAVRPSTFEVEMLDEDYDEPIDLYGGDAMIDGAYDA